MRAEFIQQVASIDKERLVYLDESGIEDNAVPLYGWSERGNRCYGVKSYQHKYRVSMIAGLYQGNIIAPLIFNGTCNTAMFEAYVQTQLLKKLKPGQIVVPDCCYGQHQFP